MVRMVPMARIHGPLPNEGVALPALGLPGLPRLILGSIRLTTRKSEL